MADFNDFKAKNNASPQAWFRAGKFLQISAPTFRANLVNALSFNMEANFPQIFCFFEYKNHVFCSHLLDFWTSAQAGWAQRHQTPSKDPRSSPLPSHLFPLPTFTPNLLRWHFASLLLIKFSLTKILIWILMTINLIAISQFLEAFCPTMLTADHFQVQTYCMKRKIIVDWVMFSIFQFLGECSTCSKSLHSGNMRRNFYQFPMMIMIFLEN